MMETREVFFSLTSVIASGCVLSRVRASNYRAMTVGRTLKHTVPETRPPGGGGTQADRMWHNWGLLARKPIMGIMQQAMGVCVRVRVRVRAYMCVEG